MKNELMQTGGSDLILCRGLSKNYGINWALQDVNLQIGSGKIIGLLGPNGSGKTTLIKILCSLLQKTSGEVFVDGQVPGPRTKAVISYLPDRPYFPDWMKADEMLNFFEDFYADFDRERANAMCRSLGIVTSQKFKTMSKGTKEKIQLILVMSRRAKLYLLDEPIAGVDPAARDFILDTILKNYDASASVIISTHLITDIERALDEVIFLQNGVVIKHDSVDNIRASEGKSVDAVFREIFRANPYYGDGGDYNAC